MIPRPVALALTICDRVIVEEGTRNTTLVSTFSRLVVDHFPTNPERLVVCAVLTDGFGTARISISVMHVETEQMVYQVATPLRFPDRLQEVRVIFRVTKCVFPLPGRYVITLLVDDEWVAQRHLDLSLKN
jgi:hypothetical protein